MILLRYIGFMLVDVKHRLQATKYKNSYLIDADDIEKYNNFREAFGHEVWLVISNKEEEEYKKWYWVPTREIVKRFDKISVKYGKEFCYIVPKNDCIQMNNKDAFSQLFNILFSRAK